MTKTLKGRDQGFDPDANVRSIYNLLQSDNSVISFGVDSGFWSTGAFELRIRSLILSWALSPSEHQAFY